MKIKEAIRFSLRNGNSFFLSNVVARKGFIVESELFNDMFFIGSEIVYSTEKNRRYFNIYRFCKCSGRVFKLPDTERCTVTGAKIKLLLCVENVNNIIEYQKYGSKAERTHGSIYIGGEYNG